MTASRDTKTTPGTEEGPLTRQDLHLLFFFPQQQPPTHLPPGRTLLLGRNHPSFQGDQEISADHARLERHLGQFSVADLGSKNGTFLDGERLPPRKTTPLEVGQILRLGGRLALVVQHSIQQPFRPFGRLSPTTIDDGHALFGSERLAFIVDQLRTLAQGDSSVLIEGETGTGKEGTARLLHELGIPRRTGPFFAFNCGAVPDSIAESELFGHVKGAFTSASRGHDGYLKQAERGSLFLDELLELTPSTQAKLLRAFQEKLYRPVGSERSVPLTARVIAALQGSFEDALEESRLRRDLGYRLSQARFRLPPLRERREDIYWLFRIFFARRLGIVPDQVKPPSAAFVERLCLAPWPGNVRELESLAGRVADLCSPSNPHPRRHHLQGLLQLPEPESPEILRRMGFANLSPAQQDKLRNAVEEALRKHNGKVVHAARALGIQRTSFYRLIQDDLKLPPELHRGS